MMEMNSAVTMPADSPDSKRYNRVRRWLGIADFVLGLLLLLALLVTGWSGAIGSDPVTLLDERGWKSYGVDNDLRGDFFGYGHIKARSGRRFLERQYAPRPAKTAGIVFARIAMSIQSDQFSR